MPDRIDQAARALDTADKILTLGQRILAALGRGNPKRRATWLRLRAISRRRRAATVRSERRRVNLLAGAAADNAMAQVLDPTGTCATP